jgi:hypothetical protein
LVSETKYFEEGAHMDRIVAVCGLLCDQCGAYQATQAGDEAGLEQVAAQWREEYKNPTFTKENVACDGCLAVDGRLCSHCFECSTRACGFSKGLANCGECAEYEACERIQDFFRYVPAAKIVLDEIHAGLSR